MIDGHGVCGVCKKKISPASKTCITCYRRRKKPSQEQQELFVPQGRQLPKHILEEFWDYAKDLESMFNNGFLEEKYGGVDFKVLAEERKGLYVHELSVEQEKILFQAIMRVADDAKSVAYVTIDDVDGVNADLSYLLHYFCREVGAQSVVCKQCEESFFACTTSPAYQFSICGSCYDRSGLGGGD